MEFLGLNTAYRAGFICQIAWSKVSFALGQVKMEVWWPGACFSKARETYRAHKAIFRSSVSKNGEEYTNEISCIR